MTTPDPLDLGEMETAADPPMEFLKFGRLPALDAEYARPVLNPAEQRMWRVLDDGRLALQPDVVEADLSPEVRAVIKRGRGVQAQSSGAGTIGSGERLRPWFESLARRLQNVVILDRDWASALTPTLLMDTATSPNVVRAVFLDPPYEYNDRTVGLYVSDEVGVDPPARAAYDWAVANGERYRVAYCAHADDFPLPDGWTSIEQRMSGRKRDARNETIYFSPACLTGDEERQGVMSL